MSVLTKKFYTAMPNHCEEKTIRKNFNTALQRHMKKFKWTIEYQEPRAQLGDFHNIIGYTHAHMSVDTKFKTLFLAHMHSGVLEAASCIYIKNKSNESTMY